MELVALHNGNMTKCIVCSQSCNRTIASPVVKPSGTFFQMYCYKCFIDKQSAKSQIELISKSIKLFFEREMKRIDMGDYGHGYSTKHCKCLKKKEDFLPTPMPSMPIQKKVYKGDLCCERCYVCAFKGLKLHL
jgi:hypothetical protein